MLAYSSGPYLVRHPRRANSSRFSEPQKSNVLVQRLVFNSLTFFKIPKILCALPVRDVTRTLSPCFVLGYCDISEWHVRPRPLPPASRWLLTNPLLSRKVLSLTKPKGMNRNPSAIILHMLIPTTKNTGHFLFSITLSLNVGVSWS